MGKTAGRAGRLWLTPGVLGAVWMAAAQTHKVAKPEQVVRAVGVYEWTGDQAKPSASRLVPVTVFIDGELRDGGVYLPRPIPFALVPGNEYEVERAGVTQGLVVLDYARHLTPGGMAGALDEDGWYGYGTYKPVVAKKEPVLKAARTPGVIASSSGKTASAAKDATATGSQTASGSDADRPTLHRKDGSADSSGSGSAQGTASQPDPDRPTLGRRADSSGSGDTASGSSSGPDSQADPDRPTLKRRSADSGKKSKPKDDVASVTSADVLGTDPDRPSLHRGRPANLETAEFAPKSLVGTPADLHQVAAVSDAVTRPEHDFARPWTDETERLAVLAQMRAMATQRLAQYVADPPNGPVTSSVGATGGSTTAAGTAAGRSSAAAGKTGTAANGTAGKTATTASATGSGGTGTGTGSAGQGTAAVRARARAAAARAKAAKTPAISLVDEQLRGFVLSYGGAATYVYTAHIAGEGASLRYVTVVAQAEVTGDLRPALISATDAAHLDRTPWMRFVDVVDAEASNRASLLFELRSQNTRQFALYRVLGDRADQLVATGTSP